MVDFLNSGSGCSKNAQFFLLFGRNDDRKRGTVARTETPQSNTSMPEKGSLFIQNFIKRVKAHGRDLDLSQIMTATIHDVGSINVPCTDDRTGHGDEKTVKQNPYYKTFLTKFFFFPPLSKTN